MNIYATAILCVLGLAAGQILFKVSANAAADSGSFLSFKPLMMLLGAICLYGVTTVAWVWILQKAELSRLYPLMAFAFVLVPVGSYFVFGDRLPPGYLVGVVLIVAGVIMAVRS